ncbi:MAG: family peptidase, partial [Labilithrix sp.]|nr:family peptidase [Labilithrix sp.]
MAGSIVVADRGNCLYEQKAVHAEAARAVGLIVVNNVPGSPPPEMFDVDETLHTKLPVLSVSYDDGLILKDAILGGAPVATMVRDIGIERDSTLDNTIVAHEWGHLLHMRLVDCASPQCRAQSEGWADFIALHTMVRENDAIDGTFAVAGYASYVLGDSAYYGIRRAPYSRAPTKNALRFRHIADGEPLPTQHPMRENAASWNSEFHAAGEIWASMLFDGYLAMLEEAKKPGSRFASFADAKRTMADYVVGGMVLAPADPTFTEQRDALLMAAMARDPRDARLLAEAFGARGAGTCAVSPFRDSIDFTDVQEAYGVRSDLRLEIVDVTDGPRSCDHDGVLDAGEGGQVEVRVANLGPIASSNTTLQATSSTPALSFPDGPTLDLGEIAPFSSRSVRIPLQVATTASAVNVDFTLVLGSSNGCAATVEAKRSTWIHYDAVPTTSDTVETRRSAWTPKLLKGGTEAAWRVTPGPSARGGHVWHAPEEYADSDAALESPVLDVSTNAPFVVTFEHRHSFRHSHNQFYLDGGVVEVSRDDGQTWEDVSTYVAPGYRGRLLEGTLNP